MNGGAEPITYGIDPCFLFYFQIGILAIIYFLSKRIRRRNNEKQNQIR